MKKNKLEIIKFKNPKIKCSIHGLKKLVQATKYGSAECEQCLKDVIEFYNDNSQKS